jgi:hypothetical protein
MDILIGLAIGLALVTLVGHGLWLLAAALVRLLAGSASSHPVDRRCPRCDYRLRVGERICPYCGLAPAQEPLSEAGDLSAAARMVRLLLERGRIDSETAGRVEQALLARRRELIDPPSKPSLPVLAELAPREPVVLRPALAAPLPAEQPILEVLPLTVAPAPPAIVASVARPLPPPSSPKPRRTLANVLAAFMEDRNILWGELVGGLLIVGCSVALVISLWQSLEAVPYFPFLLFTAITAALFGAGEYTLHHWKLESTSRGLLVIALLLTPLNLLVLGDPSAVGRAGVEAGDIVDFAIKIVALLGFTALASVAGRDLISVDLVRPGRLITGGVIGAVIGPMLGSAVLDLSRGEFVLIFGCVSLVAQAFATARATSVTSRQVRSAFSVIGLSSFATAVALGFLVTRGSDPGASLHYLGVMLPLTGACILLAGLRMQRLMTQEEEQVNNGWRTVASAVAGIGLAMVVAGVLLAWPATIPLIATGLVGGLLVTILAFQFRLPGLHAAALPCLALATLVVFHQFAGNLPAKHTEIPARLLVTPESGAVLAGFAVVLTILGEVLARCGRREHAVAYSSGAVGAMSVGLLTVTFGGITEPATAAAVYGMAAACSLASNLRWRRPVLEYAGLGLAVGASLWALQRVRAGDWPLWSSVLGAESAFLALGNLRTNVTRSGRAWRDLAVTTAVLAVHLMATNPVAPTWYSATNAALAIAALFLAVAGRSPGWFAACQVGVTASALFAVNAWLSGRGWLAEPFDPRALQAYGVGLGVVSLAWVVARLALRSSRTAADIGLTGFTVDRVVLAGLVVGQLALALVGVGPGVVAELTPGRPTTPPAELAYTYGPEARILLGLLALVLIVSLWERGRRRAVLGLALLAFTVPVLVAGPFAEELATASALRWGLAGCYLVVSALVWAREPIAKLASTAGITFAPGTLTGRATRGVLGIAAASVFGLTVWLAALGFAGRTPAGPLSDSFFARIGWTAAAVTPLALLVIGMAGHAIRERSPAYAFVGGLLADVTLAGGYALALVTAGVAIGESEGVRLAQLATLGASVWALGWMLVRRWLYGRDGDRVHLLQPATAAPLLVLQIALAVGGNLVLFGGAVALRGNVLVDPQKWSIEAGSALGAAALLAALAAFVAWHLQRGESLTWQALFFVGFTVPILLACAAERSWSSSGYTVLLLAWPGYILLWSLSTLRPAWRSRILPGVAFDDTELPLAVALASLFTAIVATKTLAVLRVYPAPVMASALTALAFAALAVARRWELLAFVAALLGNVAVSLVVVQHYGDADIALWMLPLARANVVASATAALAWLAIRRRLRALAAPGPFLAMQAALGLTLNSLLLLAPVAMLLETPGRALSPSLRPELPISGWPALFLATAAAFWYLQQTAPVRRLDVLGIFGLSAGVLLACVAAQWDTGNWLSYHVLSASWAVIGLAGVVAGSVAYALRVSGLSEDVSQPRAVRFAALFPAHGLRRWIEITCGVVAVLALRGGWDDPYRPYPSSTALLLVSIMTAALAMWYRGTSHVWASGLALNLAGVVLWLPWGPETLDSFLLVNAIGLAAAAAFWTAVALALPGDRRPVDRESNPPFAHFAALVACVLVLSVVARGLAADLSFVPSVEVSQLAWPAVLMVGVALSISLWDAFVLWPVAGLYGLGLVAVGLVLHEARLDAATLTRSGTLALAGYVLLASLVRRASSGRLVESLRVPPREGAWFFPVQCVAASTVALLGLTISVGFPTTLTERLTGAAAAALLVPAAVLLGTAGRRRALIFGAFVLIAVGLAVPDPAGNAAWLNRNALVFAALVVANLAYGDGLPRLLRQPSAWTDEARRTGTLFGLLTGVALPALLAQEIWLFDRAASRTAMASYCVYLVPVCIAVVILAAIRCAVQPARDRLGLSERGRQGYVYGAEILLLLLAGHLQMTAPELFSGWIANYWTLLVMLLGFLGMGLSELFERRGLRVLAEPLRRTGLLLPAVPLVAYWIKLPLVPAMAYPQDLGQYAVLWLLLALLYGLAASLWRSPIFGLLSALALNFGLWSLLANGDVAFLTHPQVWLIPPALIVLVAEYLNRERLGDDVAASLRYLGICTIYVSSTADLFIAGLGNSVALPIVLAALAVCGVLAGISLRVRAFLFLGVSFLLLDVLTMIWHAAVDRYHTWVWWLSGIVLGAAILALFAVFEKRRNDVLRLLDEIKRWN